MSWNPTPTIGSANWQGNAQLATKNQLLSSVSGLYADIQDIGLSSITVGDLKVSTLTVANWLSAPIINVCTLHAQAIDISGVALDPSGVIITNAISANQALFNLQILSSLEFKQTFNNSVNVSVDLHVGEAISGALTGLGFLIFETLLGLGAGLGAAFQGIGNGIAAMISARGSQTTYINNNQFELLGGSTQLQVSTLGNAYPLYSSITRFVSSSAANVVPGREIFVSSFFLPGQICIRSISDPFPMMTSDSNLNTSTIQQFGEWVPLAGLEPSDMVGNSLSTNLISAGQILSGSNTTFFQGITGGQSNAYNAGIQFTTGATNLARLIGYNQNLYMQTSQGFIFTQPGTLVENASLYLGTTANASLLNVSSIYSRGNIQSQTLFASSITAEALTVISTINVTNTNIANVTSTQTVEANNIYANFADISTFAPFFFSSQLGNPTGPFDINKYDNILSTTYDQVSSLTQNILNYSLNVSVLDEPNFNIGDPGPLGVTYKVTPQNISQWASTQIIFNGYQGPGAIDLGWVAQWGVTPGDLGGVAPGGATFDVIYGPSPAQQYQYSAPFYLTENSNNSYPVGVSTFYQQANPDLPYPVSFTARMTLPPIVGGSRSGWWQMTTPCPPPYATSNNNTFKIFQDINDTYITATDRLHLQAGDIIMDGSFTLSNVNAQSVTAPLVNSSNGFFVNFVSTGNVFTSTLYASAFVSTPQYNNPLTFTGSINNTPIQTPMNFSYNFNTTDYQIQRTLTVPSRGPNMFNSMNVNEWNNTIWYAPLGTNATTGGPQIYLGELTRTSGFAYGPAKFWINNTVLPAVPFPVSVVRSGGWLSSIGTAVTTGTGFNLIQTPDGVNWTLTQNVPNPVGLGGQSYSNNYNLLMNQQLAQLNVGMPYTEVVSGTKSIVANKVMLNANQIRTITYGSPSFPPREAGFELSSYFDANVVFEGSSTQSDAVNNIISPSGSLGYACVAWSPQLWFGRMRTDFGIQGFEIEAVVSAISGTFGDLIWASHRYINITLSPAEANIREIYFMVPVNWMTYENMLGPY